MLKSEPSDKILATDKKIEFLDFQEEPDFFILCIEDKKTSSARVKQVSQNVGRIFISDDGGEINHSAITDSQCADIADFIIRNFVKSEGFFVYSRRETVRNAIALAISSFYDTHTSEQIKERPHNIIIYNKVLSELRKLKATS